ncbi:MAG: hypothetical protein AAGN66_16660 [Acidobacteriota bacterium]
MNDSDPTSIRGRGREILLPETGLPFAVGPDPDPARPALASPADFSLLTVAEAFGAVDWEGAKAQEIDADALTVGEFFERFSWGEQA